MPWLLLPLPAHSPQVNKGAWASWNFLGESGISTDASSDAAVTVSYWLNRLQVSRVFEAMTTSLQFLHDPHTYAIALGHGYPHLASTLYSCVK